MRRIDESMDTIKTRTEIVRTVKRLQRQKKKIVFTNGCFDILHFGHLHYLTECKKCGNILIVGLNSDASVRRIKGCGRPVIGQKERAYLLSALTCVDYVTIFSETTPKRLIEAVTPDVLAKGGDWRKEDIVGRSHVEKAGGRVVVIPFLKGYSTSRIIRRIKSIN